MKPALEFTGFATLALGLHVAAFGLIPGLGGGSAGDGGAQEVTLQAASPDLLATVQRWQTNPEAPVIETAALPAPALDTPAALPAPDASPPQPEPPPAPRITPPQPGSAAAPVSPDATAPPLPDLPQPQAGAAPLPPPSPPSASPPAMDPQRAFAPVPAPPAVLAATPPLRAPVPATTASAPPEASLPPVPQADHALAPATSVRPPARPDRAEPASARQNAPDAQQPAAPQRAQGSAETASPSRTDRSRDAASSGGPGAETLLAQWGGAVRGAVQRQLRGAGRLRGTVEVQITVQSSGTLTGVALRRSSGHAALDNAALDAARRARIPPAPEGLGGTHRFNLPLSFR